MRKKGIPLCHLADIGSSVTGLEKAILGGAAAAAGATAYLAPEGKDLLPVEKGQ